MHRSELVFDKVAELYLDATTTMGLWMWRNHTQWVAHKAKELAVKYDADVDKTVCAALLHDLGDCKFERGHSEFESWTWNTAKDILKQAGYRKIERDQILEAIRTHSCHPGHLPTTVEGKVLATADGMWHIQTNFFPIICYLNRPEGVGSYEDWQKWFMGKIDRDFNVKIMFQDEKDALMANYESLIRVFSNTSLNGR